jgi:solute carrier family 35 protein F1/2
MASPVTVDIIDDETKKESISDETPTQEVTSPRPPIDYTSFPSFAKSVCARFTSLWTKRFIWALIAGQVVSCCITCTSVTTTELVNRNWALPTTQSFFL